MMVLGSLIQIILKGIVFCTCPFVLRAMPFNTRGQFPLSPYHNITLYFNTIMYTLNPFKFVTIIKPLDFRSTAESTYN